MGLDLVEGKTGSVDQPITKELLIGYLKATGTNLPDKFMDQFLHTAQAFGLNPFKREIYAISYGSNQYQKMTLIVGYEVYIKRAERSERMDGWNVTTVGNLNKLHNAWMSGYGNNKKKIDGWEGDDFKAVITIHRKDRKHPFIHEVDFSEYVQENAMWAGKPKTMIKKVAMAQGFRLAFPDELGGLPYTADELPTNMTGGAQSSEQMGKDLDIKQPEVQSNPKSSPKKAATKEDPRASAKGNEGVADAEIVHPNEMDSKKKSAHSVNNQASAEQASLDASGQAEEPTVDRKKAIKEDLRQRMLSCETVLEMRSEATAFELEYNMKIKDDSDFTCICRARDFFITNPNATEIFLENIMWNKQLNPLF